ncbi:hypothetical protein WMY93_017037 [Mugilogobius chulae]|uniref:Uncharacterized protein n=1 Tax=Mugilogobius chulae TaxID=88201 RepID=A0AAW0NRW5_9GOBI
MATPPPDGATLVNLRPEDIGIVVSVPLVLGGEKCGVRWGEGWYATLAGVHSCQKECTEEKRTPNKSPQSTYHPNVQHGPSTPPCHPPPSPPGAVSSKCWGQSVCVLSPAWLMFPSLTESCKQAPERLHQRHISTRTSPQL